jgi:hypothetical protein
MLVRALRFVLGAAAGFLFWWYATLFYDGALAFCAQRLLALDSRLCGPELIAAERIIEVHPRLSTAPTATIPADQLTYNLILLGALFAMSRRGGLAFAVSLGIVIITHILSLAVSVESTYAMRLGTWSDQHYANAEAYAWLSVEFLWRLVGMFAIVFVCWWLAEQRVTEPPPTARPPRSSGGRRRGRAAERGRR